MFTPYLTDMLTFLIEVRSDVHTQPARRTVKQLSIFFHPTHPRNIKCGKSLKLTILCLSNTANYQRNELSVLQIKIRS